MKNASILFALLSFALPLSAQSVGPAVLNATGGKATIAGNTYEYAIGDVVAGNTYIASGLVVTAGVLQPKIASGTDIPAPGIALNLLAVFPNPASHVLYLQPKFNKQGLLQYGLHDAAGRIVAQKEIKLGQGNERQELRMTGFAAGQYTLNVLWQQGGKTFSNAYKIQKID